MSNGYNFTERVRKVLHMAREQASALHHEYVGTEHILLGLLADNEGVAIAVLESMQIDRDALRATLLQIVQRGKEAQATGPDLPYTSRAKKVLELAMENARKLSHGYVGTEHLLMALIDEEKGIAAQVLIRAGATLAEVRSEATRIVGSSDVSTEGVSARGSLRTREARPVASVEIKVHFRDGAQETRVFTGVSEAHSYLTSLSF
ncbi:MAG: Clp protease N-terminal domain-containing protein [Gemmatimonas sp.]